jgi:hypothetical protein
MYRLSPHRFIFRNQESRSARGSLPGTVGGAFSRKNTRGLILKYKEGDGIACGPLRNVYGKISQVRTGCTIIDVNVDSYTLLWILPNHF